MAELETCVRKRWVRVWTSALASLTVDSLGSPQPVEEYFGTGPLLRQGCLVK
jgi:hypothetical protein